MPEKTPRLCVECGGAYPAEDQTRFCIYPTALGACRGKILPKPTGERSAEAKEKEKP